MEAGRIKLNIILLLFIHSPSFYGLHSQDMTDSLTPIRGGFRGGGGGVLWVRFIKESTTARDGYFLTLCNAILIRYCENGKE